MIIEVKGGEAIMALATMTDSRLQLIFEDGLDEEGKPLFSNKNFNNVKTSSTTDQLYAVTMALVPLQQLQLSGIERDDTSVVTSDA